MKKLAAPLALAFAALTMPQATQAATLAKPAQDALLRALEDEYHAEAFYAAVMKKFGAVRPFSNIIKAEQTHSARLANLMKAYGLTVPKNTQLGSTKINAAVPGTLAAACAIGVQAEIANRDLYDKQLMPAVARYGDIKTVFGQLSAASENNHLPAFKRCAAAN